MFKMTNFPILALIFFLISCSPGSQENKRMLQNQQSLINQVNTDFIIPYSNLEGTNSNLLQINETAPDPELSENSVNKYGEYYEKDLGSTEMNVSQEDDKFEPKKEYYYYDRYDRTKLCQKYPSCLFEYGIKPYPNKMLLERDDIKNSFKKNMLINKGKEINQQISKGFYKMGNGGFKDHLGSLIERKNCKIRRLENKTYCIDNCDGVCVCCFKRIKHINITKSVLASLSFIIGSTSLLNFIFSELCLIDENFDSPVCKIYDNSVLFVLSILYSPAGIFLSPILGYCAWDPCCKKYNNYRLDKLRMENAKINDISKYIKNGTYSPSKEAKGYYGFRNVNSCFCCQTICPKKIDDDAIELGIRYGKCCKIIPYPVKERMINPCLKNIFCKPLSFCFSPISTCFKYCFKKMGCWCEKNPQEIIMNLNEDETELELTVGNTN